VAYPLKGPSVRGRFPGFQLARTCATIAFRLSHQSGADYLLVLDGADLAIWSLSMKSLTSKVDTVLDKQGAGGSVSGPWGHSSHPPYSFVSAR
jgi:hypothetical protein